ncbi:MAG: cohesin domain-containing protein, partial [Bacteroidia bacterium]|nr:cohesin domain-containing protein [Bacteroidia bacterium]MDW8333509.1 cohesin domain-containing protein [Bacteroidia bacterium]
MMKKVNIALAALSLCMTTATFVQAQLAYIADAPAVVNPGEVFLVPVTLNGTINNLNAIRVDINFNPAHFEITSNTKSTVIQLGGGFFDGGTNNISYINVPTGPSMGPVNSSGLIQLLVGRQGIGGNPNPVPVATGLAFKLQLRCKSSAPVQTLSAIQLSNGEAVQIVGEGQQQIFLQTQGDQTCIGGNCVTQQVNELCIIAPTSVNAGQTFTATVRIDNADRPFSSIAVQIRYNTQYLNALSVTRSDEYISDFEDVPPTINDVLGVVDVLVSGENTGAGNGGVLFTITFQATPAPPSTSVADMFIFTDGLATFGTTPEGQDTDLNNTCGTTFVTINVPTSNCPAGSIAAQGPTTFCQGGSVTLASNITNAVGATFQWWRGSSPITGANGQTLVVNQSGAYYLQVIKEGCQDLVTNTINVTVNPLPEFSAMAEPPTICAGGSTTLMAVGSANFVWTDGVNSAQGPEVDVTLFSTTTFTVTATNANGCQSSRTVMVSVNPNPNVQISGPSTALVGEEITLTASGALTYIWDTGQEGPSISGTSDQPGPITLCVTGTDANGCSDTECFTVTFIQEGDCPTEASIIYNGPTTFCEGGSLLLTANTNDVGVSYQWWVDRGNGLAPIPGATGVTYAATMSGTYYLQVLKPGCEMLVSAGVEINVLSNPNVEIINATPVTCLSTGVILAATGAGPNAVYDWGGGITTADGEFLLDFPSEPGDYQYTVVATDENGCSGVATTGVTVLPDPEVQIVSSDPDNVVCAGESVTLTASGAGAGASYVWTWGQNIVEDNQITDFPSETTTYTVLGQNDIGCINFAEITITVAPNPDVEVLSPEVVCQGDLAGIGAVGADFYIWSTGDEGDFILIAPNQTTTYWVVGFNEFGCSDYEEFTIFVNPAPQITASASATTVFVGQGVTLTASGGIFYEWYPEDLLDNSFGQT